MGRPDARVLTWFDWGEDAIWHLSPSGIRVSMDGRRETVYSDRVIQDHIRFYRGEPGMVSYPEHIGADHVWLPSRFPIIASLRSAGWQTISTTVSPWSWRAARVRIQEFSTSAATCSFPGRSQRPPNAQRPT